MIPGLPSKEPVFERETKAPEKSVSVGEESLNERNNVGMGYVVPRESNHILEKLDGLTDTIKVTNANE